MQKDSKLNDIAKTIPAYAKYTSPDMQNAIIENMASIVKNRITSMAKNSDCKCS